VYLEGLTGEPRVIHPAAATPFTFGIVTSSFGDSVVLDDRASMVEALHERVLALLGETPDDERALLARAADGESSLGAERQGAGTSPVLADGRGQPLLIGRPG
jgi:hypothetical protein